MDDKPHEECGVFACVAKDPSVHVANIIFKGLMALQHRGQQASGLSIVDHNKRIHTYKDLGLVFESLNQEIISKMWGNVGIGHVRYGTAGSGDIKNAQPFHYETTQTPPFSIVFNGNITNYQILKEQLKQRGRIFLTNGDTEVIANLIASHYMVTQNWVENLEYTIRLLDGSFSLVLLTNQGDIYYYRSGNKPLIFGELETMNTTVFLVASESCAITSLGGNIIRDVNPGEIMHVHQDHKFHTEKQMQVKPHHCIFEWVYFARADSTIDCINVHQSRVNMGELLAEQSPVESDNAIVIPVPDSGRSAALGYARASGIPYEEGLMKNRYVFRSFIEPSQAERMQLVRMKLNPVREIIEGKDVVILDDSIVRGTTMNRIIKLIRNAGANSVHVRSASPPIAHPCFYGVDFPSHEELVFGKYVNQGKSYDEMVQLVCEEIGADTVAYLSIENLIKAIGLPREDLCLACLNGNHWYNHKETETYLRNGRI